MRTKRGLDAFGAARHAAGMRGRANHVVAIVAVATAVITACSSGSGKRSEPESPTSAEATTTTTTIARSYSARVTNAVQVPIAFRQGVARAGSTWVFSFNDGLYRADDTYKVTKQLQPAIPAAWKARGYNHIGDIDVEGGIVYAPLEQPDYALDHQAMLTYDANTFAFLGGVEIRQHEASFVTVDPVAHLAYSMDRFGGHALTRYDITQRWKRLAPLPMSTTVARVQGADLHDGAAWLSTDDAGEGVYRVDLATGAVQRLGSIGYVKGEGEGIDATPTSAGDLHVLSIDPAGILVRLVDLGVRSRPAG